MAISPLSSAFRDAPNRHAGSRTGAITDTADGGPYPAVANGTYTSDDIAIRSGEICDPYSPKPAPDGGKQWYPHNTLGSARLDKVQTSAKGFPVHT